MPGLSDEQMILVRMLFVSPYIRRISDPTERVMRVYNALVAITGNDLGHADLWQLLEATDLEEFSSPEEELIIIPRGINFYRDWQAWALAGLSLGFGLMFALMKCGLSMCMG